MHPAGCVRKQEPAFLLVNGHMVGLGGLEPPASSLSVTHGPAGPPWRMKTGSASEPLGRPLLRGGGERRVDRISDLRVCRESGAFSTQWSWAWRPTPAHENVARSPGDVGFAWCS